jgi:L-fuconolactonase
MSLPLSIVDAHVHFWNPQRLNYPWLAGLPALNRAFMPDAFSAAAGTADVGKMIFVECGCDPTLKNWISELATRETRIKGIVAHASLERGAAARSELAALALFPLVKGVRRNLQAETDAAFCLRPDFIYGVRLLAEFDFTFDLCVVHSQLPAVTELVCRCPEIHFILDHCGKPAIRDRQLDPWRQHLRELAALPNVVCKVSGLLTEADWANWQPAELQSYVRHAIDCFGFDRVLFGGDWPVLTLAGDYSRWLAALDFCLAGAGESDLQKLFQTNAEKIYCI